MKKISLFILTVLLIIPFGVKAATNPAVKTLEANASGSTIDYSGTMEDGSYAVMCKLYDSSDEELDLLSSSVDNNKFEGSFTNVPNGTYNVSCANYEGGEIKTVSVTINNDAEDSNSDETITTTSSNASANVGTKNPKTGDNIMNYLIVLVISVIGLTINTICVKKEKLAKNK